MTVNQKEVGRRLKQAREARGWSQLELALKTNVSPSSVSRWERGFVPPVRRLVALAELLNIEPRTLVEEQQPPSDARDEALHARFDRLEEMLRDLQSRLPLKHTNAA